VRILSLHVGESLQLDRGIRIAVVRIAHDQVTLRIESTLPVRAIPESSGSAIISLSLATKHLQS
jgi:hypothetical protein